MITATKGGKTYSYTYNNDGLRTSKTVDGVTTNYYYDGSLLIAEQSDSETIIYIYDANGSPVGFQYRNSTYSAKTYDTYWYEKDMFGNIVAVYNRNGVKLVSYKYNAWGVCYEQYHNGGANTSVVKNPFRYRGYYYDSDLGLYYLQSRYYDPNTCRFINADIMISGTNGSLHGFNLYAYCFNNPVMLTDSEGNWPEWFEKTKENVQNWLDEKVENLVDWVEETTTQIYNDIVNSYNEANAFDPSSVEFENHKFEYQKNSEYNIWNADDYAKYLKENYYEDSNRSVEGLYVELQGHYVFYLLGNSHALDGADMGEAIWEDDPTAVISELLGKIIIYMP